MSPRPTAGLIRKRSLRGVFASPWIVVVVAAVGMLALALAACGDDSETDGKPKAKDKRPPVATIAGKPITRAEFDEWYEASIKNSRSGGPGKQMAVVPDPPPYKRCLKGYDQIMTETARYLGIEHPKNECRVAWQSFMGSVMEHILNGYEAEALARKYNITVTDEEARTIFAREHLGTPAAENDYGDRTYEQLVELLGEENVLKRARTYALQRRVWAAAPPETFQEESMEVRSRVLCVPGFRMRLCSNPPDQDAATSERKQP